RRAGNPRGRFALPPGRVRRGGAARPAPGLRVGQSRGGLLPVPGVLPRVACRHQVRRRRRAAAERAGSGAVPVHAGGAEQQRFWQERPHRGRVLAGPLHAVRAVSAACALPLPARGRWLPRPAPRRQVSPPPPR
ncbi:unnamed protein product, partial [Prorocentrum cordatum]